MKILFICGSAEPGKDGVGDYTRRLSGELLRTGHEVQILSLFDHHITQYCSDKQVIENNVVLANRIPALVSDNKRFNLTQGVLNKFQPDWISLQFVPYSFNQKGLPFWLPSFLEKLEGHHKWQIMFHELWIGMDVKASFKHKVIGLLQQKIIAKTLKRIKPNIINTQTDLYKTKIASLGYKAQILPLFSNIIKNKESNHKKNKIELIFCIFGTIHHGAPVRKFIDELKQVLSNSNTVLKFVFIGHCGAGIEEWKNILLENQIQFETTGFVTDEEISTLLSSSTFGISTTPYILSQKSGSLAAMFEHQLPVLCVARNWEVKGFTQKKFLNLISYDNKETINELMGRRFILADENDLEYAAFTFLNGLK